MTMEQRKRLSEAHKGHRLSETTKAKMRGRVPWNKGKSLSKEVCLKISAKLKGRKMPYVTEANKRRNRKGVANPQHSEIMKKLWINGKMKGRTGQKTSWETRLKISNALRRENYYLYIQDKTQLVKSEKKHLDGGYKEWMLAVKNRDNWRCRIANEDCRGRLEAHHILNWIDYSELRYEVNNGISLCAFHHPRKRNDEEILSPYFQELVMSKRK